MLRSDLLRRFWLRGCVGRAFGEGRLPSNKRLKLAAPFLCGRIAFVNTKPERRSLGAIR